MTAVEKFLGILGVIGVITALTLPGRNTVGVIGATSNLLTGSLHTAETGAS
jgi:hypothetical protein